LRIQLPAIALLPPLPDPLPEPDPEPPPDPLPPDPEPEVDEFDGSITSSHELKNTTAKRTEIRASVKNGFSLKIRVCMGFSFHANQRQPLSAGNTNKFVFITVGLPLLRRILKHKP
jgi:hypothetical protein